MFIRLQDGGEEHINLNLVSRVTINEAEKKVEFYFLLSNSMDRIHKIEYVVSEYELKTLRDMLWNTK